MSMGSDPRVKRKRDRQETVRILLNKGWEPRQIAEYLGVHLTTITNDRRALGLTLGQVMARRLDDVQPLYEAKLPSDVIAVRLGITIAQAKHAVDKLVELGRVERNGRRGSNTDRSAPAELTRILRTLEPLGPALHAAMDRVDEGIYDLIPDDLTEWNKVVNDPDNIGSAYRRIRRLLKEKHIR